MQFNRRLSPLFAAALFAGTVYPPVCRGEPTAATVEGVEFFETHIRPVLVERCYECHSAKSPVLQGGLRLDSAERMRAGGDSGPVIVPHKPDESLLIEALRYESLEMPPTGKLPQNVIDDFVKWISLGRPIPRSNDENPAAPKNNPPDPRNHWAFQRPQRPAVPKVRSKSWATNRSGPFRGRKTGGGRIGAIAAGRPADALASTVLRSHRPAADGRGAGRFRRRPQRCPVRGGGRLAAWLAAVWRAMGPLLARRRPLRRHQGLCFQEDRNYKHAYKYRDWVIDSFNGDRPYDEFVVAQLAADQIDDPKSRPAIGFLTLGRRFLNNRHDIINDRIDVVTRGLMGLTVACARCHDHKYDPIPTERLLRAVRRVRQLGGKRAATMRRRCWSMATSRSTR